MSEEGEQKNGKWEKKWPKLFGGQRNEQASNDMLTIRQTNE